jgi:hypothetical protein
MRGPSIFVATNKLKPGAFEAESQRAPGLSGFLKTREPRLINIAPLHLGGFTHLE